MTWLILLKKSTFLKKNKTKIFLYFLKKTLLAQKHFKSEVSFKCLFRNIYLKITYFIEIY